MRAEEKAAGEYANVNFPQKFGSAIVPIGIHDLNKEKAIASYSSFIAGANWKASQHEWVACSERLPTEADAVDGELEILTWDNNKGCWVMWRHDLKEEVFFSYWRTPLANNFPPPKTEI